MTISLTIAGVDKTRQVQANSLKIQNILTNKRDTAEFIINNNSGDTYLPNMGQEIVVYNGATKIFGGVITEMESVGGAYKIVQHRIICQDYTRLLDHRLVPDTFENQTTDDIIAYLKLHYFPAGFTINNVDANVQIKYVQFKYRPLAQCISDLANLINYDWYVDYDKDLHFFAKEATPAPFSVSDTNGNMQYPSLIIRRDNSQIRNSIIVRGGDYLGSQITTELLGNGTDDVFPLPYRFADFHATLSSDPLSIGVDNIANPDDYDALYNFQEKILRFKSTDTPSAGSVLRVSGKPYIPVIVKYTSPSSIQATMSAEGGDGTYEYLIEDKSINSREGARQRAQAEVLAYAQTLSEGEFTTEVSGLKAGMAIDINSVSRNINETFIINRVTTVQFTKDTFIYKVSLITTRTMDLIDVLQKLLLASTRNLEIDPNEVTDIVFGFEDEMTMQDTLGTFTSHGTGYKWGPSIDTAYWDFSTWS